MGYSPASTHIITVYPTSTYPYPRSLLALSDATSSDAQCWPNAKRWSGRASDGQRQEGGLA
eukprot:8346882-Pyramimonas_sp.AAC.1